MCACNMSVFARMLYEIVVMFGFYDYQVFAVELGHSRPQKICELARKVNFYQISFFKYELDFGHQRRS